MTELGTGQQRGGTRFKLPLQPPAGRDYVESFYTGALIYFLVVRPPHVVG